MKVLLSILALFGSVAGADLDVVTSDGNFSSSDTSAYSSRASACGNKFQQEYNHNERVALCGTAVQYMIECFAKNKEYPNCTGHCGNGRDFATCDAGGLQSCGYRKVPASCVNSKICRSPGAVLAYIDSGTPAGHKLGHVEFACGDNRFCSVYSGPAEGNWVNKISHQSQTPDACWVLDPTGSRTKSTADCDAELPTPTPGDATPAPINDGGQSGGSGNGSSMLGQIMQAAMNQPQRNAPAQQGIRVLAVIPGTTTTVCQPNTYCGPTGALAAQNTLAAAQMAAIAARYHLTRFPLVFPTPRFPVYDPAVHK